MPHPNDFKDRSLGDNLLGLFVEVTGAAGGGFIGLRNQSANPNKPSAGKRLFLDNSGVLKSIDSAGTVASVGGAGGGDVSGPGSSTDNALLRWDGTAGDTAQDSDVTVDDDGNMSGVQTLTADSARITGGIKDTNGNELIRPGATASAANDITVTNAATGNAPSVAASGDDINIDFIVGGKGTGGVQIKGVVINAQTGTTYTLVAADNGKLVTLTNAGAITLTVPSGLGNFACAIYQGGAGQVTITPSSTTVRNRQSHTKIAGQYGVVGLAFNGTTDEFVLSGDTAA